MYLLNPVLGALLLFFGRSLYWMFVAVAGFLVGVQLVDSFVAGQPDTTRLLVGLAAGLIGALVARAAQKIAFAFGGFYAGGYLAMQLSATWPNGADELVWFLVGGVLGAFMALALMDWAIVILSSLVGARAIVDALTLAPGTQTLAFVVLVAIGIAFQARRLKEGRD